MSLQDTWNRYVTLSAAQVAELTTQGGSQYDAAFGADLATIYNQRLFGFQNFTGPAAGSNNFPGGGEGWSGPTKS